MKKISIAIIIIGIICITCASIILIHQNTVKETKEYTVNDAKDYILENTSYDLETLKYKGQNDDGEFVFESTTTIGFELVINLEDNSNYWTRDIGGIEEG